MQNNKTPVVFTGKAGEYFGIWIVNLLLSIITLGIYSAWAKVRRKKYFLNHTLIDGVGFDYHAKPIAILKGRMIAVILFVLYQVLAGFSPIVASILFLAFLVALPWIIVRGLTFNARNSSHRGLRFDFDGKYGQAALTFIAYPLLVLFTLGLALPFVSQRVNKFVFNHHKFGLSHYQMQAIVKDFYLIYFKLLGVIVVIGLILSLAISGIVKNHKINITKPQKIVLSTPHSGFLKVATTTARANEKSQQDFLDQLNPEERAEFEALMKNRQLQGHTVEHTPDTRIKKDNPIKKLFGPYANKLGLIIYLAFLGIALLYATVIFSITAYIKSRISNLLWNNTTLEHVEFFSNQRMRDLTWLYLSNTAVLIITLGLATPWAQIRLARYRAEHLALTGETNWDQFVGEKKEASRATGEEIAEMFDIDLSFG
jgi:uncharacterized membrane protein YjgN (DUF898 family)